MPYTPDTWANNDPTKPLNATRLTKLAGQYPQVMADLPGKIADSGDPIGAALSSTIGALIAATPQRGSLGPLWVVDGDSITIESVVTNLGNQGRGAGWASEFEAISDGRVQVLFNAGVAGQRSDQALARFDAYVAPYAPDVVLLTIGTNDIIQSVSLATWQANIIAYLAKCRAIGATLLIGAIWPSHDITPTGHQAINRLWNDWLYTWAASEGVTVVAWDALTDPSTGGWPASWTSDGIHPNGNLARDGIAQFALTQLGPLMAAPSVRRATSNGVDLLPNGFMTNLGTAVAAPTITSATASTASGTLPAGSYQYKVSARALYGESVKSAASTAAVLASPGKVDLVLPNGTPTGNKGFAVYRKGPGDADFYYIASIASGTYTFTDDGTFPAVAGDTGFAVDVSRVPTGLTAGGSTRYKRGGGLLSGVAGFRGNVLRVCAIDSAATQTGDYFSVSVTPGDVLEVTMKVRAHGGLRAQPILRFYNGGSTNGTALIYQMEYPLDGIILCRLRATVPASSTTVRIGVETGLNVDGGYVDFGEIGLRKIS